MKTVFSEIIQDLMNYLKLATIFQNGIIQILPCTCPIPPYTQTISIGRKDSNLAMHGILALLKNCRWSFLQLKEGFDNHKILLGKLQFYGIRGRVTSGLRSRDSCRDAFRDWGILPLQSQYTFSLRYLL
jgi:hypothetical protein